jgi:hypothetical protein
MAADKVQDFLSTVPPPTRDIVLALRQVIRAAVPELHEHIKWNAPSYQAGGDDRITFNLAAKDAAVQIVFHCGAKAKDTKSGERLVADPSGRVKWATDQRGVVRFSGLDEVAAAADWLREFVVDWIAATARR